MLDNINCNKIRVFIQVREEFDRADPQRGDGPLLLGAEG